MTTQNIPALLVVKLANKRKVNLRRVLIINEWYIK